MTEYDLNELKQLPIPEPQALAHSAKLSDLIRAEIKQAGGVIPFQRFMELALYAPGLGYYSGGTKKFGFDGDFVTAPEISALFSRCLARQCQQILHKTEGDILELGAGSGRMAADILHELALLDCLPQRYFIVELSADLRHRQQQTIAQQVPHLASRVHWLNALSDQPAQNMIAPIIIANEVLDAMPVQRFCISEQGPMLMGVTSDADGFAWQTMPGDEYLRKQILAIEQNLGRALPVGYESEWNPLLSGWLGTLCSTHSEAVILLIDYGYEARDYYHEQHDRGTLVCHYRHRQHDNPLVLVGLQDLSTSVDFSALAQAASACGLQVNGYTRQSYFLFGCGLEQLLSEVDPDSGLDYLKLSQQIKHLTLPSEMGDRFKAIALSQHWHEPLIGFTVRDERERL